MSIDKQSGADERKPIDANDFEQIAKERPDDFFLKGSGVLKLTGAIRQLEREIRELKERPSAPANPNAMRDDLLAVKNLIAADVLAAMCQSVAQYREMLIAAIDLRSSVPADMPASDTATSVVSRRGVATCSSQRAQGKPYHE